MIIKDLDDVSENYNKYFINISDDENMKKIINKLDDFYLEGVLYIQYNKEIVLDFRYWDLVDQLWAYFFNMIDEYMQKDEVAMSFPDQPLKIYMKKISTDLLLFELGDQGNRGRWSFPTLLFFKTLLEGGDYFFNKLMSHVDATNSYYSECVHELEMIKELKEKYKLI